MKRFLSLILILTMLFAALAVPASAVNAVSGTDAAETLAALGLFKGTGSGYELDRGATRAEALAMLLRLLGEEQRAKAETGPCPFDDGGWAAALITYAWKTGLVQGRSETHFGSDEAVSVRDWLTMLLRALGYSDAEGDFTWERSIAFADRVGLTHGEYTAGDELLREDLAILSYNALTCRVADGSETLLDRLYLDGVVSLAALRATRLYSSLTALLAEKTEYTATEIHDNCTPAVFNVSIYADEDAVKNDLPSGQGTGFFITPDGVAAMCYHELTSGIAMRATTLDGRSYDVTGVLYWDGFWDIAVVRVSRTDTQGRTVPYFPYLERGDSDALRAGERIYMLGNSLGFTDSITDGIISNPKRNVDDPDYLCIQHTAPASSGSSGGALVNTRGEVVGVEFAGMVNGESMNLSIPINVIKDVPLTGMGTPLAEVKAAEDAKKAAAVLTADQTELALTYGDVVQVMISHDGPCLASIRYQIGEWNVVACTWGRFVTKRSVPLTIRAIGDGDAEIVITFADGSGNDSETVIHVTVTGTPKEMEDPLPSGETELPA